VRKKLGIVGAVVVVVLLLDQLLKFWVKNSMSVNDEPIALAGDWFRMIYIENPGMAFGTTFGTGMWPKLALSILRIVAISGIGYYIFTQAKAKAHTGFLIALGFIWAGATGNLIDSMFYDYWFSYDPCLSFNRMDGSGISTDCGFRGTIETRPTGFLLGNVVDMFQFNLTWPQWGPYLGGGDVFPAIWNIADGSITVGVVLVLLRHRTFFPEKENSESSNSKTVSRIKNWFKK
jgi:signal peptidase II